MVQPRGVQTEHVPLVGFADLRVVPLLSYLLRNLEPPERLDLPLRGTIPEGIGAEVDPTRSSCASLSHVSSLRSSRDIFDTPFLGRCSTKDVRSGNRGERARIGDVEGRRARLTLTRVICETTTGPAYHPMEDYRLSEVLSTIDPHALRDTPAGSSPVLIAISPLAGLAIRSKRHASRSLRPRI